MTVRFSPGALLVTSTVAPETPAPFGSRTLPEIVPEALCASAAAAPSRSTKMTEDNLLIFLPLLVDTPRPTRPPPGRKRPSVCVRLNGFVGGKGPCASSLILPRPQRAIPMPSRTSGGRSRLSVRDESLRAWEVGEIGRAH